MVSVREMVEQRTEKISSSLDELNKQLDSGDFDQMVDVANTIGQQSDELTSKLQKVAKAIEDDQEDSGDGSDADDEKKDKNDKGSRSAKK